MNNLKAKAQWSIVSPKVHRDLMRILGRLDLERLSFEDGERVRSAAAEKSLEARTREHTGARESGFVRELTPIIKNLSDRYSTTSFYLFFQPTDHKGVYRLSSDGVSNHALEILKDDGNIASFVDSELRFGFLLDLERGGGGWPTILLVEDLESGGISLLAQLLFLLQTLRAISFLGRSAG